jgi:hypothetical protein
MEGNPDIKLEFESEPMFVSVVKGLVKINTDKNIGFRLRKGQEYYMYLPDTDEFIHLKCYGVAIRAADLKILKMSKKGKRVYDSDDCIFGYQFEEFDTVNFASFKYREKCELYVIEDVYTPKVPISEMFSD